jgi:preprotein translocase subunit YajC
MFAIALAANPGAAPQGGGLMSLLPLILIFVILYFLLIRPQQKKAKAHQQFVADLKKGDKVITSGGLYGRITGLTDKYITLEIAEQVRVKVVRSHVVGSSSDQDACAPTSGGG